MAVVENITSVAKGQVGYDELVPWFRERLVRCDSS